MPGRQDFQKLADLRLDEVITLYNNGMYDGAKYLSGYVIETALKARICKILNDDFPTGDIARSFNIHHMENLLKLAGLRKQFEQDAKSNTNLNTNWNIVVKWDVSIRYDSGNTSKKEVEDIISALTDNQDGILTWIKSQW